MRTISKRQRRIEETSTYLCKEVDPEYLGREIYADTVDTPYSFYLIRKLTLAKDYQNLAEGEAFFEVICNSWDDSKAFKELVVKKIYIYVETEAIYYTLLMGSFGPTRSELRTSLKNWLDALSLEALDSSLAEKQEQTVTTAEVQGLLKQMMEMSNELFRLRKMINDLNQTIANGQLTSAPVKRNPVVSRSIRTIHLKRAQPLMVDNRPAEDIEEGTVSVAAADSKIAQPTVETTAENVLTNKPETAADPTIDETAPSSEEMPQTRGLTIARLTRKTSKAVLKDWRAMSALLKESTRIKAPIQTDIIIKAALAKLEDDIYQHFMNKRMRLGAKKTQAQKKSILRTELLEKINQAEYIDYSWAQVLRTQNEDILLNGRLSCAGLIASLEDFLQEMRDITYSRSIFGKKVRCSTDMLRRLDGYLLLDQYLQKLRTSVGKNKALSKISH
ncbi:hypothetical protein GIX45_05245 [Erwinia sp. CPCC 100877]|nr:hypothetical protein [Erwinia sp. CPCC 100877]